MRTRRTGDYLILPSGGSKTIARYMIDEKIPKEKREQILLLAEGSHVLWVVGFRISEYYKIDRTIQKTILQVHLRRRKRLWQIRSEYCCRKKT